MKQFKVFAYIFIISTFWPGCTGCRHGLTGAVMLRLRPCGRIFIVPRNIFPLDQSLFGSRKIDIEFM